MKRVLLISTAHPATDSRIIYKIAPSLAGRYEVFCALPQLKSGSRANWQAIRLPRVERLIPRLCFSHPIALAKCLWLRPHIVHIFMPELIPLALLFHLLGSEVIYEVQENLFKKFAIKQYNNSLILQKLFAFFDQIARKRFHCIFTDDAYLEEYRDLGKPHAVIHNYVSLPVVDAFSHSSAHAPCPELFYLGVVSRERCLDVMVQAMAILNQTHPDCHLHLFGPLRVNTNELENMQGYTEVRHHITFHGYTDQQTAMPYAARAMAGIALLKPVADYPESFPTKLFEYMALKLPVITSDFPIYRQIVASSDCGFCISPDDPQVLSEILTRCIDDAAMRCRMGANGRKAAEARYNWLTEEEKMLAFYTGVLSN